jgi:KUP system potassium uptake protein
MSQLQGQTGPESSVGPDTSGGPTSGSEQDIAAFVEHLDEMAEAEIRHGPRKSTSALVLGAVGVVYGDIGTSPIYAFREAIKPVAGGTIVPSDVLGLLSLLVWTVILIVTVKYVLILLRADNKGEGGVLSLFLLAQSAGGGRSRFVLALGIAGAALFIGDAVITPAISVLSAVEGAGLILPALESLVLPVTLGILIGLFAVQRRGTGAIAALFGPVTAVWFGALAAIGLYHIVNGPAVLWAFNPLHGAGFLATHPGITAVVLGAVFLAVTGAEALYADLGHFGRRPITLAWVWVVFPALVLNYLGQGALVLADPTAADDPFFKSVSAPLLPILVALATAATIIASQAVITGAFSMARSAIQLGLLPRMRINHTSHEQSGQIYIGAVNFLLLIGVVWLVIVFKTSGALASAYGIAVTGTMLVTTCLAVIYALRARLLRPVPVLALALPVAVVEIGFLVSNLTKLADGGYVPVVLALVIGFVMVCWWRGARIMRLKGQAIAIGMEGFVAKMAKSSAGTVPGTAFYLSPSRETVPSALLHSLKHFRVLHEKVVLLTVESLEVPVADPAERAQYEVIDPRFSQLTLRFGFMETPNVAQAMAAARKAGLRFDVMTSTFFLGRRKPVVTGELGLSRLMDEVFATLSRMAADPTDYFHLPRERVIEMGYRVAV